MTVIRNRHKLTLGSLSSAHMTGKYKTRLSACRHAGMELFSGGIYYVGQLPCGAWTWSLDDAELKIQGCTDIERRRKG